MVNLTTKQRCERSLNFTFGQSIQRYRNFVFWHVSTETNPRQLSCDNRIALFTIASRPISITYLTVSLPADKTHLNSGVELAASEIPYVQFLLCINRRRRYSSDGVVTLSTADAVVSTKFVQRGKVRVSIVFETRQSELFGRERRAARRNFRRRSFVLRCDRKAVVVGINRTRARVFFLAKMRRDRIVERFQSSTLGKEVSTITSITGGARDRIDFVGAAFDFWHE